MTTKQYLMQGKNAGEELKKKMARMERMQRRLPAAAEPAQLALQIKDLQEAVAQEVDRLLYHQRDLGALIAQLADCNHRGVLTLRYLCGLRWDQVAERMHYSSRHLYRMHKQALEALEDSRANQKWSA